MYHYHSHGKSLIYPILIFKSWYWSIVISVQHYKGDLMGYDGNTHGEIYNQCKHNMRVIHKNVANKASFPVKATIFSPMKSWFSRWESWSCSSLSLVKILMFPVQFHILPVKILVFPVRIHQNGHTEHRQVPSRGPDDSSWGDPPKRSGSAAPGPPAPEEGGWVRWLVRIPSKIPVFHSSWWLEHPRIHGYPMDPIYMEYISISINFHWSS